MLIIIAILLGVWIAKEGCRKNALLNEYEFLMADVYQAQQDCKDQLGVFYKADNSTWDPVGINSGGDE